MAWRYATGLLVLLLAGTTIAAQTQLLTEANPAGKHYRITLIMTLKGDLHVRQDGKVRKLPLNAEAKHEYVERAIQAGGQRTIGKSVRHYETAKVDITVNENKSSRSLRAQRHLLIAERTKDGVLSWCPKGCLTQGELDLTRHFDTLAVSGLLPAKAVAVGDSWKVHNAVAQALCGFDGLTINNLKCTLVSVADGSAAVSIVGHAGGIENGANINLKIDGSLQYDLEKKHIVSARWKQNDQRDQGPVSPAMKADMTVKMTRSAVAAAPEVSAAALAGVDIKSAPAAKFTALEFTEKKGRFRALPDRTWTLVAETDHHVVLRLLDKGELIAQATLTPWPKTAPGKHLSAAEFKKEMSESPVWEQESVLEKESQEVKGPPGYWMYRLAALGKLNGLKAKQYFYLIAGPQGQQLVAAFTFTPENATKFGARHLDFVRSISFSTMSK